jgi:hypothetical protein
MQALLTESFIIPEPLQNIPGSNLRKDKYYDQIALWNGEPLRRKACASIQPYRAEVFDLYDVVYKDEEEALYRPLMKKSDSNEFYSSYKTWRTHQISDHLPMWVELQIDFSDAYLEDLGSKLESDILD